MRMEETKHTIRFLSHYSGQLFNEFKLYFVMSRCETIFGQCHGNAMCKAAKLELEQFFKIKQDKLKSAQLLCKEITCRYNIHEGWQSSEDIPIKQMEEHETA